MTTIYRRIQLRGGTASAWTTANPILSSRELGFETDTGWFKIGNGGHWNDNTVYYKPLPEGEDGPLVPPVELIGNGDWGLTIQNEDLDNPSIGLALDGSGGIYISNGDDPLTSGANLWIGDDLELLITGGGDGNVTMAGNLFYAVGAGRVPYYPTNDSEPSTTRGYSSSKIEDRIAEIFTEDGPVITDQSDGHTYRIISTAGILSTELVT